MSYPTLSPGDKGKDVEKLQTLLNQKLKQEDRTMITEDIKVNGNFGNHTEEFVRNFQLSAFLRADGKVGKKTWAALNGSEAFNCFDLPQYLEAPNKYVCWAASTSMLLGQPTVSFNRPVGVNFEMQQNGTVGGIENSHQNMRKFASAYAMCMTENSNLTCTQICWLLTNNGRLMINVSGIDSGLPNGSANDSHFMVLVGARGDGTASGTTVTIYDPSYRFYPNKNATAVNIHSFQHFKTKYPKLTYQAFCILQNYSSPIY